jgi:hypothetical protein
MYCGSRRRPAATPASCRSPSLLDAPLPPQPLPLQVRENATSPEGLEEYLEFRAGTDLRWPYA